MRIVGNWIAPLLRLENKFRYKVYRGFLTFLDTGLSDVVERVVSALESDDSYEGTDDMDLDDEFD